MCVITSVHVPALYERFCNEARCGCSGRNGTGASCAMLEVKELFRAERRRD